jgi:hypothetical protein
MDMRRINIAAFVIAFIYAGSVPAQTYSEGVTVCLRGNHVIHENQLRTFTVTVSGMAKELSGYLELQTPASAQYNHFSVPDPYKINVYEPNNSAFICNAPLPPNTRSVDVIVTYPPELPPYCHIIASPIPHQTCINPS